MEEVSKENCNGETEECVAEKETLENVDSNTETAMDDKEKKAECKEDCLQDEKELIGEDKTDEPEPFDEESSSDMKEPLNQSPENNKKENNDSVDYLNNEFNEDEVESDHGKISDDPKQKILWAAEKNEIDVVRQLLEEESSLINAKDEDLYTPLHRACSNNHVEIIKLLLSCGADLRARTEDGWCPLHCACHWDSVEAASLLLQNGADVNATSKGGLSPLHLAAANSSGRRTLELLLWHPHVDGSLKAENGDTAYDIACRTSNTLLRLFELLDESSNRF